MLTMQTAPNPTQNAAMPSSNPTSSTTKSPSLLSIVLLGTKDAQSIAESLTTVLEHCVGLGGADVTVVLQGEAVTHKSLFNGLGSEINVLTSAGDVADAWSLGIESTSSSWMLLMTEDIRLTSHWLNPILSYLTDHQEATAVTPSVVSGESMSQTNTPDQTNGVCLMLSRSALAENRIAEATHIESARVESVSASAPAPMPTPNRLASAVKSMDQTPQTRSTRIVVNNANDLASYANASVEEVELTTSSFDLALVADCYRVLQPGGRLRLTLTK